MAALDIDTSSDVLKVGWPILGIVTLTQTAWMSLKLLRRYRGYRA